MTGFGIGVQRVWLKNHDFPGLAMSRSLGDKLAHTVGVIPDPGKEHVFIIIDFFSYTLNKEEYEYVVVSASDGLWDQYTPE